MFQSSDFLLVPTFNYKTGRRVIVFFIVRFQEWGSGYEKEPSLYTCDKADVCEGPLIQFVKEFIVVLTLKEAVVTLKQDKTISEKRF